MPSKTIIFNGESLEIEVQEQSAEHVIFMMNGQRYSYQLRERHEHGVTLADSHGRTLRSIVGRADKDGVSRIWMDNAEVTLALPSRKRSDEQMGPQNAKAPLTGIIRAVEVSEGDHVAKGAALVVMEAMKMQMTISAPYAGFVQAVHVAVGDQVTEGTQLVSLEETADAG